MIDKAHLEDTVRNYLQTDTSFALLIAGKWGSGKTYFYENSIVPLAKKIKPENLPFEFLPIRISLFGVNSIEEMESEIVASLYPFLKNSTLKAGFGLAKALTKGIVKNKFGVELDDYLHKSLDVDKAEIINKEHVLLCFDDLERRGSKLEASQVIGYINSMVENHGSKVIILTNEDKIDGKDYKDFKEKTIGISIVFEQDISKIYDDYTQEKFGSKNKPYFNFLISHKTDILNIVSHANSNLRIIIDSIRRFELIFDFINNSNVIKKQDAIESAIRFLVGLSIDFKLGLLPQDAVEEFGRANLGIAGLNWNPAASMNFLEKKAEEGKVDYLDVFKGKYYLAESDFKYYPSLFNYIVYYNSLDELRFLDEIIQFFPTPVQEPDYIVAFRAVENNYADLSISEYKAATQVVVDFASKGKYGFTNTVSVVFYAIRFENPNDYDIKILVDMLIDGLHKASSSHVYDDILNLKLEIKGDHPYYEQMVRLTSAAIELNLAKLEERTREVSNQFKEVFDKDIKVFLDIIKAQENYYGNVFQAFNAEDFVKNLLSRFTYRQMLVLNNFLKHKYAGLNVDSLAVDHTFLDSVLQIADNIPTEELNFMQKPAMNEFVTILKRIKAHSNG